MSEKEVAETISSKHHKYDIVKTYLPILNISIRLGNEMKQQGTNGIVIPFPKSGEHPESAFVDWILNHYTLEEIKGFILHQFNPEYFVNQRKFQRFVKLCKLVDIDKHSKERMQLMTRCTRKSSPISERITLKYNEPFIAASLKCRNSNLIT